MTSERETLLLRRLSLTDQKFAAIEELMGKQTQLEAMLRQQIVVLEKQIAVVDPRWLYVCKAAFKAIRRKGQSNANT